MTNQLPFQDEQTIDGVRYYIKDDMSLVIADKWDEMFIPKHRSKPVLNKKWKGENPDKRNAWVKGVKSY